MVHIKRIKQLPVKVKDLRVLDCFVVGETSTTLYMVIDDKENSDVRKKCVCLVDGTVSITTDSVLMYSVYAEINWKNN